MIPARRGTTTMTQEDKRRRRQYIERTAPDRADLVAKRPWMDLCTASGYARSPWGLHFETLRLRRMQRWISLKGDAHWRLGGATMVGRMPVVRCIWRVAACSKVYGAVVRIESTDVNDMICRLSFARAGSLPSMPSFRFKNTDRKTHLLFLSGPLKRKVDLSVLSSRRNEHCTNA
jgi:hypothetical protein